MKQFLTKLGRNTAGNTFMLVGAGLLPIALMIGGGLDASMTYSARAKLQNACDAGALAGRLAMIGTDWTTEAENEAHKFFDFNFPSGTQGVTDAVFEIEQDSNDNAKLIGKATGTVPTTIMKIVGYDSMDINVNCDAKRDMGHNDVMLVLDVTGSMQKEPAVGGGTPKIDLLREGVLGLYRALDDGGDTGSQTRYGFMPYSQTVNVGEALQNRDILRNQYFVDATQVCDNGKCGYELAGKKLIGAKDSYYNNGQNGSANANAIIQGFRTSGDACIEERPTFGTEYNDGEFTITTAPTIDDINAAPGNAVDEDLQFGRYEAVTQEGVWSGWSPCISPAKEFAEYDDEAAFQTAVNQTTARVDGGTFSDLGLMWGMRFASRDGVLKLKNPKAVDDFPVNVHMIFFTDGQIYGTDQHYSSYGFQRFQNRLIGDGTYHDSGKPFETSDRTENHRERFRNSCALAKSMGITIWVVVLDTMWNQDFVNCATSPSHFYESDGSDLEDKFTQIGQGIGNLRLTK